MLQTKAKLRPSSTQMLELLPVAKRIEKYFPEETHTDRSTLLQEIKIPKNMMFLGERLPVPSYEATRMKNKSEAKLKLPHLVTPKMDKDSTMKGQKQIGSIPAN